MKNRPRGGLGRGLGALIPTGPARSSAVMPAPIQPGPADHADPSIAAQPDPELVVPPTADAPVAADDELAPPAVAEVEADSAAELAAVDTDVVDDGSATDAVEVSAISDVDLEREFDAIDVEVAGAAADGSTSYALGEVSAGSAAAHHNDVVDDRDADYGDAGEVEFARPDRPAVELAPVPGARFAEIPLSLIVPNAKNPRHVFDEEALDELKTSIREVGFLQPIVVREVADGKYELVMGERRWRAAQAVGKETIPAIVRETHDDAMLRDALLENIHRAQLNPLEEAAAYQQLLEEFGATHEDLAKRIGRSRPQITNTIRLLNLPARVQRRVAAGVLSAGHARALLGLDDNDAQEAMAQRIVGEGLSVRATEELVTLAVSDGRQKSTRRRAKAQAPALNDWADRLSERFDTKVRVDLGRNKGKIVIEFGSVSDLERIARIMESPELVEDDD